MSLLSSLLTPTTSGGGGTPLGQWSAATNTPTLPNPPTAPTYKVGDYYTVSVGGTRFGFDWTENDKIVVAPDGANLQWNKETGGAIDSISGNIVNNADPSNPIINQIQADWNAVSGLGAILNKPSANLSFAFGDASPVNVIIAQAAQLIESVRILILTPFDGVGATLEVGDTGQSDRLLSQSQVNPAIAATYESNPNYTYGSTTQIKLTINSGTGATQGSGLLVITYKS
jgi:hypothetical protein